MDLHITQTDSTIGYILVGLLFALTVYIFIVKRKHKSLIEQLDQNHDIHKNILDVIDDAVMLLSKTNEILYINPTMRRILGLSENSTEDRLDALPEVQYKNKYVTLDRLVKEEHKDNSKTLSFRNTSFRMQNAAKTRPVDLHINHFKNGQYFIAIHDLESQTHYEESLLKNQFSELPNKIKLQHNLHKIYAKVHMEKVRFALLAIDIDNISELRAIFGMKQTDNLLVTFANFLKRIETPLDYSVYHISYSGFILTVNNPKSLDEVYKFAEKIQKEMVGFYKIDGVNLHLTASIGIASYPESGSTHTLLDSAYKALSTAQKEGYGRIHVHWPRKKNNYTELQLHNSMRKGFENKEFEVYYQPILDSKTKEIVAAEALVRWNHEKFGLIMPNVFIPLMEKTGFVLELGRYVLKEVLKQQKRWDFFGFKEIEISINVTLIELEKGGFSDAVQEELKNYQIDPGRIKFEITEGNAMSSEKTTQKEIEMLKKMGITIALDDFGTGYTSFSYLKRFPADILKIDKSLVENILTKEEDRRVIQSMIDVAHHLGMKIVVEGVENRQIEELVVGFGCDYLQGYHFSKPVPAYEFQEFIRLL